MKTYRLFVWGSKIAPLLPEALGNAICDLIGLLVYYLAPVRRKIVLCNLAHALPDYPLPKRRWIARHIFQTSIRNYYDLLRAYKIPKAKLDQKVIVTGIPEMKALSAQNGYKGMLVYSGHLGSFSLCPQVASYNEVDFYLAVEPVKPPELFELTRRFREIDPRVHTVSVGSVEVRELFRALKQPEALVCLAIDRDVTGGGSRLNFFGSPATLPLGAAEIALRTKALLVPIHVYKKDKHYRIDFWHEKAFVAESTGDKAADIQRTAQRMLEQVEAIIRKTPEQWVVLQPIWDDCGEGMRDEG